MNSSPPSYPFVPSFSFVVFSPHNFLHQFCTIILSTIQKKNSPLRLMPQHLSLIPSSSRAATPFLYLLCVPIFPAVVLLFNRLVQQQPLANKTKSMFLTSYEKEKLVALALTCEKPTSLFFLFFFSIRNSTSVLPLFFFGQRPTKRI